MTRSRRTRVRSKIIAMLLSLAALWAFAAYVTVQAGLNLLWINTLDKGVGRPADALVTALQAERRVTVVALGERDLDALAAVREDTDAARAVLASSAGTTAVRWAADDQFEAEVAELLARLADLEITREGVDSGESTRRAAAASYTAMIDAAFRVYDRLGQYATEISAEGRTVVALSRARELVAREDTLLSGALAARSFADGESAEFALAVGAQRAFYAEEAARLSAADRAGYDVVAAGDRVLAMRELEDQVVAKARDGAAPPFTADAWRGAVDPALAQLRQFELDLADAILARATPAAAGIIIRLALAGGLGLVAVIASIVVSVTTARHLVRQLERLRGAALELASYRLPRVVERLAHGERVDVTHEAPPLDFGDDEIGQVGKAFNTVQETAVRVAVEQAELRRSVRDVFLSLARRSQALLHRQLGLLDAMERRAGDPEQLSELFRVDHLATRMRRNAENLIVLSGATAGRAWRKPVPMAEVLRGALAEVEDYTRVTVLPADPAALVGHAVSDVIHLLAELIENAVTFSPPQALVRVGGSVVGNGYAIEIEDRGLGLSEPERFAANEALLHPPEFRLTSTARLGLYVVGQLAQRHGIRVRLAESTYGGTTAIVLLPAALVTGDLAGDGQSGRIRVRGASPLFEDKRAPRLASAVVGRPRHNVADPPAGGDGAQASAPSTADRRLQPVEYTPAGLPWRRRDTASPSIEQHGPGQTANHGANQGTNHSAGHGGGANDPRTGEAVRDRMSAYRLGTLRGRTDAARLGDAPVEAHEYSAEQVDGTLKREPGTRDLGIPDLGLTLNAADGNEEGR